VNLNRKGSLATEGGVKALRVGEMDERKELQEGETEGGSAPLKPNMETKPLEQIGSKVRKISHECEVGREGRA